MSVTWFLIKGTSTSNNTRGMYTTNPDNVPLISPAVYDNNILYNNSNPYYGIVCNGSYGARVQLAYKGTSPSSSYDAIISTYSAMLSNQLFGADPTDVVNTIAVGGGAQSITNYTISGKRRLKSLLSAPSTWYANTCFIAVNCLITTARGGEYECISFSTGAHSTSYITSSSVTTTNYMSPYFYTLGSDMYSNHYCFTSSLSSATVVDEFIDALLDFGDIPQNIPAMFYEWLNTNTDEIYPYSYIIKSYNGRSDYEVLEEAPDMTSATLSTIGTTHYLVMTGSNNENYTITWKSEEVPEGQVFLGLSKTCNSGYAEYPTGSTFNVNWQGATLYEIYGSEASDYTKFEVNLYQNTAEDVRVNKSSYLTPVATLSGALRYEADLTNPELIIELYEVPQFNYVYIGAINRYYFVQSIGSVRYGLWRVQLKCDVLMTYKDKIYNLDALIARNEYNYNDLLIDKRLPLEYPHSYEYSYFNTCFEVAGSDMVSQAYPIFVTVINRNGFESSGSFTGTIGNLYNLPTENFYPWSHSNVQVIKLTTLSDLHDFWYAVLSDTELVPFIISMYKLPVNNESAGIYATKAIDYVQLGNSTVLTGGSYEALTTSSRVPPVYEVNVGSILPASPWYYYPPYTTVEMYIPYYGWITLPMEEVSSFSVTVRFVFDFVYGSCRFTVLTPNCIIYEGDIDFTLDIPITYTNSQDQKRQHIANAINLVGGAFNSAATMFNKYPNPARTVASGVGAVTDYVANEVCNVHTGGISKSGDSFTKLFGSTKVIVRRAVPVVALNTIDYSEYNRLEGRPLNEIKSLSEVFGYTEVAETHMEGFPLALYNEKNEIETLLKQGVILSDGVNYNITAVSGTGYSIACNYSTAVEGTTVTFNVNVSYNYSLNDVAVTNVTSGGSVNYMYTSSGYSFIMPAGNVYITASVTYDIVEYTITTNSDDYTTIFTNATSASAGDLVKFTVSVDDGYELQSISVTTESGNEVGYVTSISGYWFYMPAENVIITTVAHKAITLYSVTAIAGTGTSISISATSYSAGVMVYFTVKVDDGYTLSNIEVVTDSGEYINPSYAIPSLGEYGFTMPADNVTITTVAHKAITLYSVTAIAGTGTSISISATSYSAGVMVYFTVKVDDGYTLSNIEVVTDSGEYINPSYAIPSLGEYGFTMPADNVTITTTATVTSTNYTAYVRTAQWCDVMINDSPESNTLNAGDTGIITITPVSGYELEECSVKTSDGTIIAVTIEQYSSSPLMYHGTFTMPAEDVWIDAYCQASTYSISVDYIYNATVSVPSSGAYGDTITATVACTSGYLVSSFVVIDALGNFVTLTSSSFNSSTYTGTYSFTMPNSNVTISITLVTGEYYTIYNAGQTDTINYIQYGREFNSYAAVSGSTVTLFVDVTSDLVNNDLSVKLYNWSLFKEIATPVLVSQYYTLPTVYTREYTFTMPESDVFVVTSVLYD